MTHSNSPDKKSDLIDLVHHEHDHLVKLFEDIGDTFEQLAEGNISEARYREIVESAGDDLQVALEEMLHHFNQEEEVFFVEIESRFPELASDIEQLAETHDEMCQRTRWLQKQLKQAPESIDDNAEEIMAVVRRMTESLYEHTTNEHELFDTALRNMSSDDREELLDEMRRI